MSQFAKIVSPKQLITTGVEGFFGLTTPNLALNSNPGKTAFYSLSLFIECADCVEPTHYPLFLCAFSTLACLIQKGSDEWDSWICEGTDFVRFHNLPHIDFTVAHMYPDLWVDRPCNGSDYCKKP